MKRCPQCGQIKFSGKFHKNSSHKDGLSSQCKRCVLKNQSTNRDQHNALWRKWYAKNKKTRRAYQRRLSAQRAKRDPLYWKKQYKKFGEAQRKNKRNFAHNHPDIIRERNRTWKRKHYRSHYDSHRTDYLRWVHRRRVMISSAPGCFTNVDINNKMLRQKERCFYCATSIRSQYTIDHKTPVSRGGTNFPGNLVLACKSCNSSKQAMTTKEFFDKIKERCV